MFLITPMKLTPIGIFGVGMLLCGSLLGQTVTLSGYLRDSETRQALSGATVCTASGTGVRTNDYGFFSLQLPPGRQTVLTRYIGYEPGTFPINLVSDTLLTWEMAPGFMADSVQITAYRINDDRLGAIRLSIETIKNLPTLGGEPDVLKAVQLLPGVKFGNEGTSGLFVRGGTPDQNLILLDDVPVYNAAHLFGFTSIFHPYALGGVELYKGAFPARYGGRLSSVLDIRTREGNPNTFKGQARIGIISSNLLLEGPLIKGKASYLISARRSLYEVYTLPVRLVQRSYSQGAYTNFYFYDVNARLDWHLSPRDHLIFSGYFGQDKLSITDFIAVDTLKADQQQVVKWGNQIASLSWNHLWNERLFSRMTAYFNRYQLGLDNSNNAEFIPRTGTGSQLSDETTYQSRIQDWGLMWNFSWSPGPRHQVKWGLHGIAHNFLPGAFSNTLRINGVVEDSTQQGLAEDLIAYEGRVYIEDNILLLPSLTFNAGLHASWFNVRGRNYRSLEPRLLLEWRPASAWTFSASYTQMQQYLHLLANTGLGLPLDLWVPPTDAVPPQRAWQTSVGTTWRIRPGLRLTVDAYYKSMSGLIDYLEGSSFLIEGTDWQEQVAIGGEGLAYGIEWLLVKETGRLQGQIGYTLAKTDRQFDAINEGRRYPFKYDRRHEAAISLRYALNDRVELNTNWIYATGNALTLPQAIYPSTLYPPQPFDPISAGANRDFFYFNFAGRLPQFSTRRDAEIFDYGERNSSRMPDYHRLDVGVSFQKKTKHGVNILRLSIYNAYSRINPYFIRYTLTSRGDPNDPVQVEGQFEKVGLIPILPAISYQFDF